MKIYDYYKSNEDYKQNKIFASFTENHKRENKRFEALNICPICKVSII